MDIKLEIQDSVLIGKSNKKSETEQNEEIIANLLSILEEELTTKEDDK